MVESVYKNRKSYFIFEGLSVSDSEIAKEFSAKQGFVPVFMPDHESAMEAYSKITHCVGLIAQGDVDPTVRARISDFARLSGVSTRVLSPGSDLIQEVQGIIEELFPNKLKELCSFSVSKIFPMLVPGVSLNWEEVKETRESTEGVGSDFLVSVETIAEHFTGSVSLRGKISALRGFSEFFSKMSDDDILSFMAEVGNEVLGVINFNLLKARIAAQVTLPIMLKDKDGAGFRRRSSYYLPSFSLHDPVTDLVVNFQFLVPFLKDAKFDRELNFEVGWVQEENIELF